MVESIRQSTATGKEIEDVVAKLEPVLEGVPRTHAMMACLSIAIILQNPDISLEELMEGVKGASQWIACYVSGMDGEETTEIPKERLN